MLGGDARQREAILDGVGLVKDERRTPPGEEGKYPGGFGAGGLVAKDDDRYGRLGQGMPPRPGRPFNDLRFDARLEPCHLPGPVPFNSTLSLRRWV